MQKSAVEGLTAVSRQDFPIVVAGMPASAQQRRTAIRVVILFAAIAGALAPFANVQLARLDAFIPVIQTVMCVADLVTAVLLFAQYSVEPRPAILAVASGYIMSGLFAFLQTLTFPGGYSPTGIIGDGRDSSAWLFVFWHTCFPLAILVYALFKDRPVNTSRKSVMATIGVTVACSLAAFAGLSWIATAGTAYLPSIYVGGVTQQTLVANLLNLFMWLWGFTALAVLFLRRRTVLDLWLIVTLCAWMPNFIAATVMTTFRFSVGWYMARGFALIASCTVLVVLLTETTVLYARLANLIVLLRRERADRLMSIEAATSAIVHEVRQPLAAIAMQSSAALRWLSRVPRGPEIERATQCLSSMAKAVDRAEEVVKSIRELFRQTPLRRTTLQLNDIVREVLKLTEHDLQVEGVSVTTEYDDNLPLVNVDHTQIQQVIFNLVKNAIEAMRSVSPNKRHLRVLTSFDGKLVALYVQDTGPGVDVKDRDRIFEPFFTTKPTGTGLGLSICRTIVETHGGVLRLVKADPHGSSFELAFPISSLST